MALLHSLAERLQEIEQVDGEELLEMITVSGTPLYLAPDAPSVPVPYREPSAAAA
jgi:hypothetical protein